MCCWASVIRSPMTCIIRVGSTSCVPGSSVGSGMRAGWKPCISACWGCSGAAMPSAAPSSVLWAVPPSLAARGDFLALALDKCYRLADGHSLALVSDQLCERSFVLGLELHRDFVGLDLCYGIPLRNLLALAFEPFEEGALLHRVAHLGHNDFRHLTSPPRTEPCGPRW